MWILLQLRQHVFSVLFMGGKPVARVLHTCSNILQSEYDGWYLQHPCCDLVFYSFSLLVYTGKY
jgi:hypothetical protein